MRKISEISNSFKKLNHSEWLDLRESVTPPFTEKEFKSIINFFGVTSPKEVNNFFLPLADILNSKYKYNPKKNDIKSKDSSAIKNPFIIGISGSVSSGKSTFSKILKESLMKLSEKPKVEIITTDGFLFPNSYLEDNHLMEKKGFPESYNNELLFEFLTKIKEGLGVIYAPTYSHKVYDVMPSEKIKIERPDILIVEGINVLQALNKNNNIFTSNFSDFFNFSIYIDAEKKDLSGWFIDRFLSLRLDALNQKEDYFNRFSSISEKEATSIAEIIWEEINLKNLNENILPSRNNADLIVKKNKEHKVNEIWLKNS